jgi:hypothetical protein
MYDECENMWNEEWWDIMMYGVFLDVEISMEMFTENGLIWINKNIWGISLDYEMVWYWWCMGIYIDENENVLFV